ncbi:MAG: transcriptional regulator [Deltaproteobacteria bacterium]|nr:transcriptional regulator [Deltaproteobacteria bacterium]
MTAHSAMRNLDIPLERDLFLRTLIRELATILEEVVGYEEAAGYISLVGQKIGLWINDIYRGALNADTLSRAQVAEVLVDLKQRIQGNFHIVEVNDEKIVLGSSSCPFVDKMLDRPSMCMMTSNVFGVITAMNLGYAKVTLEETIAQGDPRCLVTVFLKATRQSALVPGREYFGA